MAEQELQAQYEHEKNSNIRFIRAKLPNASAFDLAMIAAFVRAMGIVGWSDSEYNRDI